MTATASNIARFALLGVAASLLGACSLAFPDDRYGGTGAQEDGGSGDAGRRDGGTRDAGRDATTTCTTGSCGTGERCVAGECVTCDGDRDGAFLEDPQCGAGPYDCDDTRASVRPTAAEVCDGLDNDCDPATSAPGEDDDGDGYADVSCGGTDCDDECETCHPDVTAELCDGRDNDCDTMVDEEVDPGALTTFYRDQDADGVGDASMSMAACVAPAMYAATSGDCNDGSALVGACSAPLSCIDATTCGCRAALFNNAEWLDLDLGTTSLTSAPAGGRDIIVNNGTFARMFLQTATGTFYRRYEPADFLEVDSTFSGGVASTGEDTLEWTPATVYVVRTASGNLFKLGYFAGSTGDGRIRFVYAPLAAAPSGFRCMTLP